jgi:hypothetical protein
MGVVAYPGVPRQQLINEVQEVMRARHRLKVDQENDFDILTSDTIMNIFDQFTRAIFLALVVISSIALMVGGIGVMAIMTISVTETDARDRHPQGARRAAREILWQFLIEAVFLTSIGGLLGIAFGSLIGLWYTLGRLSRLVAVVVVRDRIGFSASVGIFLACGRHSRRRAWTRSTPFATSRRRAALFAILGTALVLRAWGIASGLPHAVGVDEPQIMGRVVRMMKTGDFNPHFFDWPSLTIYVHLVVACLVFLAGAMRGAWHSLAQVGPSDFYVTGRTVTALTGTATVGVLFAAARRWGVTTCAPGGCAARGRAEPHTRIALRADRCADRVLLHAGAADVAPRARAAGDSRLCARRPVGRTGRVLQVQRFDGRGAARDRGGRRRRLVRADLAMAADCGGCTVAGFLVGTPYAVLDLPKFLNDYSRLASVFAQPRGGEAGVVAVSEVPGPVARVGGLIAALSGLVLSIKASVTGPARARSLMLAGFTLVYYDVMATSYQIYGRYTLPLLPFVALLAAIGVTTLAGALRPRVAARLQPGVIAALVLILLAPPAVRAISFDRAMARTQTVDLAYQWLDSHVADGVVIVAETYPAQLISNRFRISSVPPLQGKTLEQYTADGVDYVLVSAAGYEPAFKSPEKYPEACAAYLSLFRQAREVASFPSAPDVPGPEFKLLRLR